MLAFSHMMVGVSNSSTAELQPYHDTHDIIHVEKAFSRIRLNVHAWPPFDIVTEPRIYLLKRKATI